MTDTDRDAQKSVEFYAASVAAWYASALEYDKSIFALSAGGIAILVTLLTTVGFSSSLVLVLFGLSIFSYLVAITALLIIFRKNPTYIESILTKAGPTRDPWLARLDLAAIVAFGLGTVLAAGVGVAAAIDSYASKRIQREASMASQGKPPQSQTQPLRETSSGAANLQAERRSYNGAGSLQPASVPAAVPSPPASAPAPAPSAATPAPSGQSGSK